MATTEIKINQMYFNVLPCASKDGDYWESVNLGKWEPETFEFMRKYIRPTINYTELGGWIGSTALGAYAYNPKKIYTIEADPANFQVLKHNISMNLAGDKITAYNACLTDKKNAGKIMMFGTANSEKPNSSSHRIDNGSRIPVLTHNALSFMKKNCELSKGGIYNIDIEGSEKYLYDVFAYLAKKDVKILLSLHAPYWINEKEQVVNKLMPEFAKYNIICPHNYTYINEKSLKDELMDNTPNKKEQGLYGRFFSIIMQSKVR